MYHLKKKEKGKKRSIFSDIPEGIHPKPIYNPKETPTVNRNLDKSIPT